MVRGAALDDWPDRQGEQLGTGLEQQMLAFLTFSISSITNQIQQCVNKRLLTAPERIRYYAEFLLRGS